MPHVENTGMTYGTSTAEMVEGLKNDKGLPAGTSIQEFMMVETQDAMEMETGT